MKRVLLSLLTIAFLQSCFAQSEIDPSRQWSVYRGPQSSGFIDNVGLPENWNIESGENIKWKVEIPGLALSSPVIWGDNLFLTTAISDIDTLGFKTGIFGSSDAVVNPEHVYKVYNFDIKTGKLKWERTAYTGIPEVGRHPKSSHANCTPVTDGKYIVTFFGSEGLYCYDFNGELIWKKSFGKLDAGAFNAESVEWEFASSPIIYDNVLILQCDVRGESFVTALDLKSGEELWKQIRDEYPTWCTPNIYENDGKKYVVLNGYKHRGAYEFESGKEIWKMSGGGDVPVPTPVIGENLIYFNSAHGRSSPIYAVKKSAIGDITLKEDELSSEYVQWSIPGGASYMHSLLLYDGLLYNMRWNGQLTCLDPLTGEQIYREKLGKAESFIASPVAADGRLYIVNDLGLVYIIASGKEFELLKTIPLDDICMVVPAITDGLIVFRTQNQLIAVGK
jgi:outer membrane protein assembly factor BamB